MSLPALNLLPSPTSTTYSTPSPRATYIYRTQPQSPANPEGKTETKKSATEGNCYTCRRRRVKCDRQLPHCAKCLRTKLECLGYTKPLIWNKGVASRGKMMGKTFPAPEAAGAKKAGGAGEGSGAAARGESPAAGGRRQKNNVLSPGPGQGEFKVDMACGPSDGQLVLAQSVPPRSPSLSIHVPEGVGSPFVGLPRDVRFYLNYFEQRASSDFLLFDNRNDNPYRVLLPQAASDPALQNAMVAVAARHHANLTDPTNDTLALPYQGRSFHFLAKTLQFGPSQILTESTLAVIMMFLFFEALDGGLNTWRVHLLGAQKLIQLGIGYAPPTQAASQMLRVFTAHATLIDIIGRTLSRGGENWESITTSETLSVLRQGSGETDTYNFLGCPPILLETLHQINSRAELPHALLSRIDVFDTTKYIESRSLPEQPDLPYLVSAYRAATRIYCLETMFPMESTKSTHEELRGQLEKIPRGSILLKGAVWPVFVAGTGARGEVERRWVRKMLARLWEVLPQCNIRSAGRELEIMWKRWDEEGGGEEVVGGAWRKWGGEGDWLFI